MAETAERLQDAAEWDTQDEVLLKPITDWPEELELDLRERDPVDTVEDVIEALRPGRLYEAIVPGALIPRIEEEDTDNLALNILGDNVVEVDGQYIELKPHELFIFNVLLLNRGQRTKWSDFKRAGFHPNGASNHAREVIFSNNRRSLGKQLNVGVPGVVSETGAKSGKEYSLNPYVLVRDFRYHPEGELQIPARASHVAVEVAKYVLIGTKLPPFMNYRDLDEMRKALQDIGQSGIAAKNKDAQHMRFKSALELRSKIDKDSTDFGDEVLVVADIVNLVLGKTTDEPWRLEANCAGMDPSEFVGPLGSKAKERQEEILEMVAEVCGPCAVKAQCLEAGKNEKPDYGFWGGEYLVDGIPTKLKTRSRPKGS